MKKLFAAGAFVALLLAWSMPSNADAMASTARPIHVNRCDPEVNTTARRVPVGFVPGYYPYGSPWRFYDVYGYYYTQPRMVDGSLDIDYVNQSPVTAKTIDFGLVANGRLVAEVRDVGTFSTGAEIKHEFGLSKNVFPLQTALARCVPLRVEFADGSIWKNPHLPTLRKSMYQP